MLKPVLIIAAFYYALVAAYLIVAPMAFYDNVPGVSTTGPFNSHFVRDVGFAFLVSAAGLYLGARRGDRTLGLLGAGFPVLHGLYHLGLWAHHSFPTNGVALADLAGTAGIASLTLLLVFTMKGATA